MHFYNSRKLIISFLGYLLIICVGNCKADNTKIIEKHINNSLIKILPKGSRWEVKSPYFLQKEIRQAQDIKVIFPNSSNLNNLIAQVWLDYGGEQELVAIPIKVNYLNNKNSALLKISSRK